PAETSPGRTLTYTIAVRNSSKFGLNGAQVRFELPENAKFAGTTGTTVTLQDCEVVLTLGHLDVGSGQTVEVPILVPSIKDPHVWLAHASLHSHTAMPVESNPVITLVR